MTNSAYSGINPEILDSYRRTLIFNNGLLKEEFDKRYEFRVGEQVRKMRAGLGFSRPSTEEEIKKYMDQQEKLRRKRRERYFKRLDASVEPAVRQYAAGIRGFIGGA
jgi:hypothetical protein